MPSTVTSSRPFEPGTTGWTVADLEDPRIEAHWFNGRYEIVEGVLTKMPAAYFSGSASLNELIYLLKTHLRSRGLPDRFGTEVDVVLGDDRVVVADGVWLSGQDQNRQAEAVRFAGKTDGRRVRILVPPTLIIESVSLGHELHDRRTKKRWYAEFGVPHYWILDPASRSLQCLVLDGASYRLDAEGRDQEEVRPALFEGLTIPLGTLWAE
ncbi:MAG TPA: Uma2 family endonuclease [Tepidisphaeraceae bacterium]|jgi:Uma2 family endonuclease